MRPSRHTAPITMTTASPLPLSLPIIVKPGERANAPRTARQAGAWMSWSESGQGGTTRLLQKCAAGIRANLWIDRGTMQLAQPGAQGLPCC